jgi:hypothetical protein
LFCKFFSLLVRWLWFIPGVPIDRPGFANTLRTELAFGIARAPHKVSVGFNAERKFILDFGWTRLAGSFRKILTRKFPEA